MERSMIGCDFDWRQTKASECTRDGGFNKAKLCVTNKVARQRLQQRTTSDNSSETPNNQQEED